MQFKLKDYQEDAVRLVLGRLADALDDYREKDRLVAFALSAITGAGKTVMASAVFEALFEGSEELEFDADPTAVVLWVTDDPNLNEQTRYRIMEASDRLGSSRLKVIEEKFDSERLSPGNVYFLNRQKLTGKTFITHSNKRTYTLWETIANTINDPDLSLYLVLDEAHRGMRPSNISKEAEETDRSSTVLRLVNGHNGTPPAPIVWGISATVERFNVAMTGAKGRTTLPNVVVDNAQVQASGLLKDTISLDLPDETGSFATVLAREAAKACQEASQLWEAYAEQEGLPEPVRPLLVVQAPNKPSAAEIKSLLDTIYDEWKDLPSDAVANVFGEHTDEKYGSHDVPYIAPQDVQDATHVRVLLAKDAISTGWDCPRAETLVSLRPAKDRTHITQLLGRLVRTPLARRIQSDERLNAVTCFLPHFNLATAKQVADVLTGVTQNGDAGSGAPSTGRVLIEPSTMLWNGSLPAAVKDCFANLPSEASPRAPAKPTKRLLNLAAEVALDELRPSPTEEAHDKLFTILDGQLAQHKAEVDENYEAILTADIKRITANRLKNESSESKRQLAADERTIDDAFKTATRAFGVAIANGYAKRLALADADEDEDFDIYGAKARVAALALLPEAVEQVELAADQKISSWFSSLHATIKTLSEERRVAYDEIKQQAKDPQPVELVVPTSRIEMTYEVDGDQKTKLPTREKHLLCDDDGNYPIGRLGESEEAVLDTELSRKETVAWYRNPSSATKDAVQVPWHDGDRWRSMQPDFLFFVEKADGAIVPAIVDPHGHHLQDAYGKLVGLANFAEKYGGHFVRIEALSKNTKGDLGTHAKGGLVLLDLSDPQVRKAVRGAGSAAASYAAAGVKYE